MGLATYKATGVGMAGLSKLLGINLRASGTENLVNRPTLFVANHFTRIETFLIPYVIFRYAERQVRSLGTHSVFRGLFGRYFEALGGLSTRHPKRNRLIVSGLMTGRADWVIYPEGGLIKNKKTVHRGRLHLTHPEREGPPHTGSAMLALKAQMCKERYLRACEESDATRMEYYQDAFDLQGAADICRDGVVITPVTLTFYPMRPSYNLLNRLAKFIVRELDPRLEEELRVEGSILLKGTEICVHFGQPIEVADYLGKVVDLARRVAGMFSEVSRTDLFLRQQARRLTDDCMRSIYGNLEVNLDHLFCDALRACEAERIPADDLRAALFLTVQELAADEHIRLHPSLSNGVTGLVTGGPYGPWARAVALAEREGVVRVEGDELVIDHEALRAEHEFHVIRLQKMTQVLANELEPIRRATQSLRRLTRLSAAQLRERTSQVLRRREALEYERDYEQVFSPLESKPRSFGEPFLLEARDGPVGVVLVHGYLASPEQVRPLAEYLHDRGVGVCAVRLAGHGTAPDQLTDVRWQRWLDDVVRGCALARQHYDRVIVGGFSLGGALALLLAARQRDAIDGVMSINAPLRLRDRRAPFVGPVLGFIGALRRLGLSDGGYRISNEGTESPDINYPTDDLRSIREVTRAAAVCRRNLERITAPALVIQSGDDPIVVPSSGRLILNRLGSADKVLCALPFNRHMIVRGRGSHEVFEIIGRFVRRVGGAGTELVRPVEQTPA